MKKYMPLGSYSSGSMRPEDIFSGIETEVSKKLRNEFWKEFEKDEYSETLSYILEEAVDQINESCAPYTYYGAHPGDGADWGVWIDIDSLEDAVRYDELLQVNDTSEVPKGYKGLVLHVNDHGNMTLYNKNNKRTDSLVEIWSIV